jgi:hypothetical protein
MTACSKTFSLGAFSPSLYWLEALADAHPSRTESQDPLSLYETRVALSARRATPPCSFWSDADHQLDQLGH